MHIVRQWGLTSYMWRSSVKNTATMSQCMTRTHTNTLTNVNTHFREDVSTQGQDIKVCFAEQLKEIRLMSACVRMNSSWHCSYLAGLRVSCSNSACVCWGLRRWRESVCVCALFLSEPKIFMNPHLCERLEKVCVCVCVSYTLVPHTLFPKAQPGFVFFHPLVLHLSTMRRKTVVITCSTNAARTRHRVPRHLPLY